MSWLEKRAPSPGLPYYRGVGTPTGTATVLPASFFQSLARPSRSQDQHAHLARLHEIGVGRLSTGEVVIGRHADCVAALRDPRFVKPRLPPAPGKAMRTLYRMFLLIDDPDHQRIRRAINPFFTQRATSERETLIEATVDSLLAGRSDLDVIADLAYPLSLGLMRRWLGLHDDTDDVARLTTTLTAALDGPAPMSVRHIPGYVAALMSRRTHPIATIRAATRLVELANRTLDQPPSEDSELLNLLHEVVAEGEIDRQEAAATWVLMLVAGHETTVNLIANTLHLLLAHPDQLDLVRQDPSFAGSALDEALRYEPVVPISARRATTDIELPSGTVEAGSLTIISLISANRDPDAYDRPDTFDITRDPKHLGFGLGGHHCIGLHLARAEATHAITRVLQRNPTATRDARWRDTFGTRGLNALPIRIDRT